MTHSCLYSVVLGAEARCKVFCDSSKSTSINVSRFPTFFLLNSPCFHEIDEVGHQRGTDVSSTYLEYPGGIKSAALSNGPFPNVTGHFRGIIAPQRSVSFQHHSSKCLLAHPCQPPLLRVISCRPSPCLEFPTVLGGA